jgi:hypothetical protein
MESAQPPGGLRPGQLSLLVLRRVIMGDIAVTLVDLAVRRLLRVEESGDGWIVCPPVAVPRHRRESLLGYERELLAGLENQGVAFLLPDLAGTLEPVLGRVRGEIVSEAVRQGWIRRLRHDQRTAKGDEIAAALGSFERRLRRMKAEVGEQALAASLLPYALHYALISRDGVPLARFASAWAEASGDLPGWRPAARRRREHPDRGMYDPPLLIG